MKGNIRLRTLSIVTLSCIILSINGCIRLASQLQNEPPIDVSKNKMPLSIVASVYQAPYVTPEYLSANQKTVKNQILVISNKGKKPFKTTDKQLKVAQVSQLNQLALDVVLLTFKSHKNKNIALAEKIAELKKKHPDRRVQPNFLYYLDGSESSKKQRAIPQYALKMTGLNKPNIIQGKGIKIALIDTPVDTQHPVFKGAGIKSFDFVDSKGKRHGTAIAGILVGRGRIKGVAPEAQLISIGVFNEPHNSKSLGLSTSFVLGKAFNKALDEKVDVINLSFGSTEIDPLMKTLAAETIRRNIILLASVGNDSHQTSVRYPAALKGVYAITAIDSKSKIYNRANTGNTVDYALPGVSILTSKPNGRYTSVTGTSFANAYASGIFALQLSQKRAINELNSSVKDLGESGKDNFFGRGLLRRSN